MQVEGKLKNQWGRRVAPALGVLANPCKGRSAGRNPWPPAGRSGDSGKRAGVRVAGRQARSQFQEPGSSGRERRGRSRQGFSSRPPSLHLPRFFFRSLTSRRRHTLLPSLTRAALPFRAACPVYLEAGIWNPRGRPLAKTQDSGALGSRAVCVSDPLES